MARSVKMAAGLLLAVSLLLPQYTCRMYHDAGGKAVPVIPKGDDPAGYAPFTERHYAWEDIKLGDLSSWVSLAVFLWPVPIFVSGMRSRSPLLRRISWWCEPPLVAASTWYIASLSALGERAAGAYLGLAANGSYGLAWLAESYEWWARRAAGGAVKAPQNGER